MSTVTLDNGLLRAEVLPGLGAKIRSLVHQPSGKEILWRNAVPDTEHKPSSSFDDSWTGGWDELFPNDEPTTFDGISFPDHGELWTASWDFEMTGRNSVYLRTDCPASRCRMEKWIELPDGEERIRFRHRLTNLTSREFPYLWKVHPALSIAPGDSILIPAKRFQLEPAFTGTLGGGPMSWCGPVLRLPGRSVDIRVAPPPESREVHFYYGLELKEGWCAVYDPSRRLAVALAFPNDLFTSCWLFASYGGWRDHYVAALEPCTAWPFRLEEAAASGQCAVLHPHGHQEARLVFSVRAGVDGVDTVRPDGQILYSVQPERSRC